MAMGVTSGPPKMESSDGLKLGMTELNPHFVCVLCFGYFVDATTITECMHTFCKSCIVNFLRTNHHCPHCDTLLSRTRPFNSLRSDRVMQSLVYKTVPGLFQTEMRRRVQFYQNHPHPDFEPDVEGIQNYIFSPEDSVSLSIRYYSFNVSDASESPSPKKEEIAEPCRRKSADDDSALVDINTVRYFRCPATVPISVLKALVKTKYRIPDFLRVELLYGEERLLDSWTLMEVAYIFQWKRESPMELSFQVLITKKVKRKRLKIVRKKKESNKPKGGSFENPPRLRSSDDSNQEPPLKIPRIEEPSSVSSADEHHPRPPTPPETPDGPADMNVESDHSSNFLSKSPNRRRDESLGSGRKTSSHATESKIDYSVADGEDFDEEKANEETFEAFKTETDSAEDQRYCNDSEDISKKTEDSFEQNSLTEEEDNCRGDDDSGDMAGDQDSEAPLEVDTSHETEPEADNDGEGDMEGGESSKYQELHKIEVDDEEQGDSAIDVNETSASEVMDSDDKDTDFNVSTESIEVEGSGYSREKKSDDKSSDEKRCDSPQDMNSEENPDNEDTKGEKDGVSGTDDLGVLDLSCHARSVRALRENLDSPVTPSPSPPSSESDRDSKIHHSLQNLLNFSQNSSNKRTLKGTFKNGQTEVSNGSNNLLASSAVISQRPPLPLDWVRPPLVGPPVAPHAAAFRDLVTLSHAAVQLQIAMAHAQAQAQVQAQAQAQAQKIQAHVQANVLKNLKASETLSFVNGSGDTLTISPIPGNHGNPKPKISSKLAKNKLNNINQNGTANKNMISSSHGHKLTKTNSPLISKPNKDLLFHNNKSKTNNMLNNEKAITNSITNKTNNNSNISNKLSNNINLTSTTANSQNSFSKSSHSNQKTTYSKSSSSSLKIPNVHLNSKTNSSKSDKEKKEVDRDKERTGDPVFKITNQKLIEFVRQQHLNNKLKQNNNNNNNSSNNNNNNNLNNTNNSSSTNKQNSTASENLTMKISTNSSSITAGQSAKAVTKPTLAVVPTSSNLNNKLNNSVTKGNNISGTHKLSMNPSANSNSVLSPTNKTSTATIASTNGTKSQNLIIPESHLQNGKTTSNTLTSKSLSISSTSSTNTLRTTNTHVRQIPNPSRLHQQSENRLSAGMGRLTGVSKKGISTGGPSEGGLSRIESLTRSLHEKVAASAGVTTGVLNSLAR